MSVCRGPFLSEGRGPRYKCNALATMLIRRGVRVLFIGCGCGGGGYGAVEEVVEEVVGGTCSRLAGVVGEGVVSIGDDGQWAKRGHGLMSFVCLRGQVE